MFISTYGRRQDMKIRPIVIKDKLGREIVLRSAELSDADDLIRYLKETAGETPFLIREPDEITLTQEQEIHFIEAKLASDRELLLVAAIDGRHIGNCSVMSIGSYKRYAHRCEVAIALYQKYCGAGIGSRMMQTALDFARSAGYEQAELEVISDNAVAISLYRKLGFRKYGQFPQNMKYADGTYADADWMMKKL